jgi:hypothetical protein
MAYPHRYLIQERRRGIWRIVKKFHTDPVKFIDAILPTAKRPAQMLRVRMTGYRTQTIAEWKRGNRTLWAVWERPVVLAASVRSAGKSPR